MGSDLYVEYQHHKANHYEEALTWLRRVSSEGRSEHATEIDAWLCRNQFLATKCICGQHGDKP